MYGDNQTVLGGGVCSYITWRTPRARKWYEEFNYKPVAAK